MTCQGQEVLVASGITADPGEAVPEEAAVEKPVDDVSHIRAEESVLAGKAFIVDLFQGLEVVFHALIKGGGLRFPGAAKILELMKENKTNRAFLHRTETRRGKYLRRIRIGGQSPGQKPRPWS
jgi:hypothetical protein